SSGIDLHCTATDADRAAIVDLTDLSSADEIRDAMRASSRLPWLAGGPVRFRGMRLLDATLAEAIPLHLACSGGATDVLVLMTRPEGVLHAGLSPLVARLTDRYLHALNPALVSLRETRSPRYDAMCSSLADWAADGDREPAVCAIRPGAGALVVSQMESRVSVLRTGASQGLRSAWMALAGEDPELIGTLRAYPAVVGAAEAADPVAGASSENGGTRGAARIGW
ncbi:MAG: hypothetical protein JO325_13750, partial [Solirubrobacterales bacterium]|nr:hypothetical protein [Solirubrobacterales bacterium]